MTDPQVIAYEQSVATSPASTRCFLAAIAYLGIPTSFNDIGCGDGHLVQLAADFGILSFGLDLNCDPQSFDLGSVVKHDLNGNLNGLVIPMAELTFCLEVGEHLPENRANRLCHYLYYCTEKFLVFSSAIPGQGGSGHVNEQPPEYWRQKLMTQGFEWMEEATADLKKIWLMVASDAWWYSQNVQVFRKR